MNYHKIHKDRLKTIHAKNAREKRHTDPFFKLRHNLRTRLGNALRAKKFIKTSKFAQYVGCSLEELKIHIEQKFSIGMTWDNYGLGIGKWNIDHIHPLSAAETKEEIIKLSHYTNLQPLWALDNLHKAAKIEGVNLNRSINSLEAKV